MRDFPVDRLPAPLTTYVRRYSPNMKTVWLVDLPRDGVAFTANDEGAVHGVLFNLESGKPEFELIRQKLEPFGPKDFRVILAEQEAERYTVRTPNQVLLKVASSNFGRSWRTTIYALQETLPLYFELSNLSAQLTREEAFYLAAVNGYISAARKQNLQRAATAGIDIAAGQRGLIAKGIIKVASNGAVTVTPDGRYYVDQPAVRKAAMELWRL